MPQNQLQPILIGGLFMGVLSALPVISLGNCCCLWVMGGGMVTAYLIQQGRVDPIQLEEGATGGFFAGIVGAVVQTVVSVPIRIVTTPLHQGLLDSVADVQPELREMVENIGSGGSIGAIVGGFVFMLAIGMVFSALGGLLGALMFRSSLPASPAPPPLPGS